MKNKKAIVIILTVLLAAAVTVGIVTAQRQTTAETVETAGQAASVEPTSTVSREVRQELREKVGSDYDLQDVTNILLIGVDNDNLAGMDELGNADGIMLLTINKNTQELIMTSVLRDTRVEVPNDYGMKITSTYHKGGVPLLREVFELNFNIPVDNYILVNYLNVVDIIDALGGVDIELTADEIKAMSGKIANIDKLAGAEQGTNAISADEAGLLHLNGVQTAAYMRIRPSSSGDDRGRTERARKVVAQVFDKVKGMSGSELLTFANGFLPNIETDMTDSELMTLAMNSEMLMGYARVSDRIPHDEDYTSSNDGNYYVLPDYDTVNEKLYKSVYEGVR